MTDGNLPMAHCYPVTPALRHPKVPVDAIVNLVNHQQQCDEDGIMVQVSRQALAEVLIYVTEVRPDNNWAQSSDGGVGSQTRKELSADPQSLMAAGNVDSLGVAPGPSDPIAWLDIRTAGLSWQNRIVATNPQFVENNGSENFVALYAAPQPLDVAQAVPSREAVEKALCCPKGCAREDDCFVEAPGARVRYTRSKREREQADAIMALYALPSTDRGGK